MSTQARPSNGKPKPRKPAAPSRGGVAGTAVALARNPLGVIALFVVLIEVVAVLFASSGANLRHDEIMPIIYFVVFFPVIVLMVFAWLVAYHSGKLFSPSEYANEDNYAALQRFPPESVISAPVLKIEETQSLLSVPPPTVETSTLIVENQPDPDLFSNYLKPQSDWGKDDFHIGTIQAVSRGNTEAMAEINQAFIVYVESIPSGVDTSTAKAEWKAFVELMRISFSKGGQLSSLRGIAATAPDSPDMHEYVAEALLVYKEYWQAAEEFERAASLSSIDRKKIGMLGKAAVAFFRAGFPSSANKAIAALRTVGVKHNTLEIDTAKAIRDFSAASKDEESEVAAMERIVELDPSDTQTRWSLAYKHAALGRHDLSLIHYLKIPLGERTPSAWNNIGVEYNQFRISSKAVNAFKKAFELGESISGSNLAEELLTAGFLDDGQKLCKQALAMPDPHSNVAHTLSRLKNAPEEDDKRETSLFEKAREKLDFHKLYGRAVQYPEPKDLPGTWQTPDCIVSVAVSDGVFRAEGEFERKSNGLLGALYPESSYPPVQMKLTLEGKIVGRSIRGQIKRFYMSESVSILSAPQGVEVLLILSDNGSELKTMELVSSGGAETLSSGFMNFYAWTRITELRPDASAS